MVGVARDVTDRKRREQQLRERVKELKAISRTAELFEADDVPIEERSGSGLWPDDRTVLQESDRIEREERVVIDGEERVYSSIVLPIDFDGGSEEPDAVFGLAVDMTEWNHDRAEMRRHENRFEEYLETLDEQIREPVATARDRLEAVREDREKEEMESVDRPLRQAVTAAENLDKRMRADRSTEP